ncbi:MAG: hypothetical protein KH704_06150 [Clostridiales bacterium]|nr:hypothetical protein [Clostridiales bacterium]
MPTQTPAPHRPDSWRISRRFEGNRSPEAVVQALIRAHMKETHIHP